MKRLHFQQSWTFDEEKGLVGNVSGAFGEALAAVLAPDNGEFRQMLGELREELQLPVAGLAAVLGVPRITLRRWLNGSRQPCGAARRLVWLLHTAQHSPDTLRQPGVWLAWGH